MRPPVEVFLAHPLQTAVFGGLTIIALIIVLLVQEYTDTQPKE